MNDKYRVIDNFKVISRQKKKIIFNPEQVNPMYFPYGGDEVLNLLKRLKKKGAFSVNLLPDYCSPELFNFLKSHFLIVPEGLKGKGSERKCNRCDSADQKSFSRSVYLLLTHSCNQACIYCLNGKDTYQKEKKLMMSEEVAYQSLQTTLDSITDNGKLEVVFFGGEPLMNWELAKKIIKYCKTVLLPENPNKSIHYHLTTNLTIFPDDLIETARKNNITFLVDIDGPEEIHNKMRPFINGKGTFQTTANNIKKLLKAGLKVSLRTTVTSYNVDLMLETARTHKELGGESSTFVPLNPVDSDINLLDTGLCPSPAKFRRGLREVFNSGIWPVEKLYPFNEYINRLKPSYRNQWGCGAPFGNTPVITASGEIFSCIYLVGNKKYELGHIFKGDFPRKDVVESMLETVNVNKRKECQNCSFKYLCGGGCPVGVFSISGNENASDELKKYTRNIACTTSKTVLEELFWDLAKKIG